MNYNKYGVETFHLIPIRVYPCTEGMSLYQLKKRVKPSYHFFPEISFFILFVKLD